MHNKWESGIGTGDESEEGVVQVLKGDFTPPKTSRFKVEACTLGSGGDWQVPLYSRVPYSLFPFFGQCSLEVYKGGQIYVSSSFDLSFWKVNSSLMAYSWMYHLES